MEKIIRDTLDDIPEGLALDLIKLASDDLTGVKVCFALTQVVLVSVYCL